MSTLNERLVTANHVLESFQPAIRLYMRVGHLRMYWDVRDGNPRYDYPAHLRGDGLWPRYGYHTPPCCGGTGLQSLVQLIRYVRNLTRFPILTWEYWSSGPVQLCGQNTVELLRQSDYGDPKKTCCILCGSAEFKGGIDWWSLNGKTGPCCYMGLCRRDES